MNNSQSKKQVRQSNEESHDERFLGSWHSRLSSILCYIASGMNQYYMCRQQDHKKRYRDVLVKQLASTGIDFQHNQQDKYCVCVIILSETTRDQPSKVLHTYSRRICSMLLGYNEMSCINLHNCKLVTNR